MEENSESLPGRLFEKANLALAGVLPQKSKALYVKEYEKFELWRNENGGTTISETVLLAYFQEMVCSSFDQLFYFL